MIEFAPLEADHGVGNGAAILRLSPSGYGLGPGMGSGDAILRLTPGGSGYGFVAGDFTPSMPGQGACSLALTPMGEGYGHGFGEGSAPLVLGIDAFGGDDPTAAVGITPLVLVPRGISTPGGIGHAYLAGRLPIVSGFAGHWFDQVEEQAVAASSLIDTMTVVLAEMVAARAALTNRADMTVRAMSAAEAGEVLSSVLLLAVADAAEAADTLGTQVLGLQRILEEALAAVTLTNNLHVTAVVAERAAAVDAVTTAAEFLAVIYESAGAAITLSLDTGDYVAWVLNTDSSGVSRYTNYPFNSFARVGGTYIGAATDGLYLLEGEDDDGADIPALVRLGLTDMGTRRLKRVPEAFIGYASDGTLLLKVVVSDEETGEKSQAVYTLAERAAASIRESRWKAGRGLKSVDWDFAIENVDGASFDLLSIEFHPLVLDRRTRG